jgi:hypothetical protein
MDFFAMFCLFALGLTWIMVKCANDDNDGKGAN